MEPFSSIHVPSQFGTITIIWQDTTDKTKVHRLLLPHEGVSTSELAAKNHRNVMHQPSPPIAQLAHRIQRFLEGEAVEFDLNILALDQCHPFQRRVLLAEYSIPRGWVSTYGRIARHLGVSGGARAVGNALARNPFPIIIPCHRAIRSDWELGGFRGGIEMKRRLLEREGIEFSPAGKVVTKRVYYST